MYIYCSYQFFLMPLCGLQINTVLILYIRVKSLAVCQYRLYKFVYNVEACTVLSLFQNAPPPPPPPTHTHTHTHTHIHKNHLRQFSAMGCFIQVKNSGPRNVTRHLLNLYVFKMIHFYIEKAHLKQVCNFLGHH